jgi:hypothetical protein
VTRPSRIPVTVTALFRVQGAQSGVHVSEPSDSLTIQENSRWPWLATCPVFSAPNLVEVCSDRIRGGGAQVPIMATRTGVVSESGSRWLESRLLSIRPRAPPGAQSRRGRRGRFPKTGRSRVLPVCVRGQRHGRDYSSAWSRRWRAFPGEDVISEHGARAPFRAAVHAYPSARSSRRRQPGDVMTADAPPDKLNAWGLPIATSSGKDSVERNRSGNGVNALPA